MEVCLLLIGWALWSGRNYSEKVVTSIPAEIVSGHIGLSLAIRKLPCLKRKSTVAPSIGRGTMEACSGAQKRRCYCGASGWVRQIAGTTTEWRGRSLYTPA